MKTWVILLGFLLPVAVILYLMEKNISESPFKSTRRTIAIQQSKVTDDKKILKFINASTSRNIINIFKTVF